MELLKLTNETIDVLSGKVSDIYYRSGASKKDILRARLLLEETLIKYKNHFGEDVQLYYREYRIFNQNRFCVRIQSPSFDPFTLEENPMAFMIQSVMSSFEGNMPTWKYRNLENEIVFSIKDQAKISGIAKVCIALIVSLILSATVKEVIQRELLVNFVTDYIEPLSNAYAGLFSIMATLITFFSLVLCIVGIGDMGSAGIIGGRAIKRFSLIAFSITVIMLLPVLPTIDFVKSGSLAIASKSVFDIIIGFIPNNIIKPFADFNSIHIIIVAAMFGFSLLAMGQKGDTSVKLCDEINTVACTTNGFLNRFIYLYVGLKIFALVTTSDFSQLEHAGRLIVYVVIGELIILFAYIAVTCLKCKITLLKYIRNMITPFIICLSSANMGACFTSLIDSLKSLDGMDDRTVIALNVGGIVFHPASTMVFLYSSIYLAKFYSVAISPVWVVTAVFLSLLLVAATPSIPGGAVAVITLLFAQLGLSNEAIALMIAINVPLQFLTVAVDTVCLASENVIQTYERKMKKTVA